MDGNRLDRALSPYLLDHAENPVHWWEWSPEALEAARTLDRPILLSIGYAACHWCHVMAHESFEDPQTAEVMNRLFINVKVDREERPDIDQLYMNALHAMGEQGGWPMTMFLTPKGKPFFGGTYFPPRPAFGRPSFRQVLESVAAAWDDKRSGIEDSADRLTDGLSRFLGQEAVRAADEVPPVRMADMAAAVLRMTDPQMGGMSGAPKFPNAPYFELLLRHGWPSGAAQARQAFLRTMTSLSQGGIYDHLGGGLHRYAVDGTWLVPHFEKMLYDNGHFLRHAAFAYRATGEALFARRITETVAFLDREMTVDGGGLAASLDADSLDATGQLHEGAFYAWTEAEIDAELKDAAPALKAAYGVTREGNFEGANVLNRPLQEVDPADALEDARRLLLAVRARRSPPKRDEKVLADWNGIAIAGLAEAYRATGDRLALQLAQGALDFVFSALMEDGRLYHAIRQGRRSGPALAGDYGALIGACVSLYAVTGDRTRLDQAGILADGLERWHADGQGGHWLTASDCEDILFRLRGDQDDAITSATGLVLDGLAMLAQVSTDPRHLGMARDAAVSAAGRIGDKDLVLPGIAVGLDRLERGSELAIIGAGSVADRMRATALARPDANRLDLLEGTTDAMEAPVPTADSGYALLCRQQSCLPPLQDAEALEQALTTSG